MGHMVAIREVEEVALIDRRHGSLQRRKRRAADGSRRKALMDIRVVGILLVLEILFRQRKRRTAQRIEERGVDLQRHIYLDATPEHTSDHAPVSIIECLLLEDRGHDDDFSNGLPECLDLSCQLRDIRIEILSHRLHNDVLGRVRQEEVRVREKEALLRLRFFEEFLRIEALQLRGVYFCPLPRWAAPPVWGGGG